MENEFKLKPVAVGTLGLPPEPSAQLTAIAKWEETPDLDTEREFREASDYLGRLSEGIETALEKTRAVPAPSEGETVFSINYANSKLGNQNFRYTITEGGGRFESYGDVAARFDNGSDRRVEFHYCGHSTQRDRFDKGRGDIVKLASDGERVFALVEKLKGSGANDYEVVRLVESEIMMFGDVSTLEPVPIDFPEFGYHIANGNTLLLEDLTVIDDQVLAVYWNLSTNTYLEFPLTKYEPGGTKTADASDM